MKLILKGIECNRGDMNVGNCIIFYREITCDFCNKLISCERENIDNGVRYKSCLNVCKKFRLKYCI